MKAGGCDSLLTILENSNTKDFFLPVEKEIQTQTIRAIKALMNNSFGLKASMDKFEIINNLALALLTSDLKIKTLILEVLAALCFCPPNGHRLILDAMQNYKEKKKERHRFSDFMGSLNQKALETEQGAAYLEYQVLIAHSGIFYFKITSR